MKVVKTAVVVDNGDNSVGTNDKIVYTITIRNTGSVNLTGLSFIDNLTDGNSAVLNLDSVPTLTTASAGSTSQTIVSGGIITFTATYTISQQANDSGSIRNSVTATASSPGKTNDITDVSDNGDDTDGNTTDDPTIVYTISQPGIEVTKTATTQDNNSNSIVDAGDKILYTIVIENTGAVTLTNLNLVDTLTDGNSQVLNLTTSPTYSSSTSSSAQGTLVVGEKETYLATYIISQNSAETGTINNSVLATASSPGNTNDVSDVSDDGDDTDGNTTNDPTQVTISSVPLIEVTKTASVTDNNNNSLNDFGDTINYTICLLYTSPSPRDATLSRMPSSA